ncbi:hypothetical protein [Pseudomonas sp. HLMP]|uniref:hypothetical protein n=1 Tax=Pseudomonas sp. HLMP TaxID=3153767 RepID=UPI003967B931
MSKELDQVVRQQLARLLLPAGWAAELTKLLMRIEDASTPMNCLMAQERVEGVIQGLELARALDMATIERLYLLTANAADGRLRQLQYDDPSLG